LIIISFPRQPEMATFAARPKTARDAPTPGHQEQDNTTAGLKLDCTSSYTWCSTWFDHSFPALYHRTYDQRSCQNCHIKTDAAEHRGKKPSVRATDRGDNCAFAGGLRGLRACRRGVRSRECAVRPRVTRVGGGVASPMPTAKVHRMVSCS